MRNLVLLLLPLALLACRDEPTSRAAIERDLKERSIREMYEEAEKIPFTPPADERLTNEHIERYVRVRSLAREITKVAEERLDNQLQSASHDENPFTRMATAFAGFGNARNMLTAEIRASLMLEENPHELLWTAQQIEKAAAVYLERERHKKEVETAAAEFDAETNSLLRDQKRRLWEMARSQQKQWLANLGDTADANSKVIEANRLALVPYHKQLARPRRRQ